MVGYSSLLPPRHMSPVPQVMLEIEAERAELTSPSTTHLSSSLVLKKCSGFHVAIQSSRYLK